MVILPRIKTSSVSNDLIIISDLKVPEGLREVKTSWLKLLRNEKSLTLLYLWFALYELAAKEIFRRCPIGRDLSS